MNITRKVTPSDMVSKHFGKEKGTRINKICTSTSWENTYEVIGIAHDNMEKLDQIQMGEFNIFQTPCFESQIITDKINKEALDYQPEILEGIHKCRRCGGKKTIQHTVQDRSGDEGATTYIMCIQCQARWKEN